MHAEISIQPTETNTTTGSNSTGVFGLILSIIGVCMCGLWLFTIPGLILSLIGLRKEPRTAATVGTVLGGIGILEFLILGPLMLGIFLPALAKAREHAQVTQTEEKIHIIMSASDVYKSDNGKYPTSLEKLEKDKLVELKDTKDPWNNTFHFEGGGNTKPVITSSGRDGEFGTDDDLPKSKDD